MTTSLPRASRALLVLVAALDLLVGTSHAQTQTQTRVLELQGSQLSVTAFGAASVMLDDIDGDGHAEIVVGAADDDDAGTNAGAVYVKSGRTGETLRKIRGMLPGDGFGVSVASLGDVDGDGRPDIVVGAPFRPTATGRGVAYVVSAATGTVLHTLQGPGQDFGSWVAGARDWDSNGTPDALAGAATANTCVCALLTPTAVLQQISISAADGIVIGVGDTDGDGRRELARTLRPFLSRRTLQTLELATNGTFTTADLAQMPETRIRLASGGDINRDGRPDIVALDDLTLYAYSSSAEIWRTTLPVVPGGFTYYALAGGVDFDQDGWPDVAVSFNKSSAFHIVRVISGRDRRVLLDRHEASGYGRSLAVHHNLNGSGTPALAVGSTFPTREYVEVFAQDNRVALGLGFGMTSSRPWLTSGDRPFRGRQVTMSASWLQPCRPTMLAMSLPPAVPLMWQGTVPLYLESAAMVPLLLPGNNQHGVYAAFPRHCDRLFVADVTGDGIKDAVGFAATTSEWFVATGTRCGFAPASLWHSGAGTGSANQFVTDVDGDGRADIVMVYLPSGDWWTGASTGSAFQPLRRWTTNFGNGSVNQLMGDVDGDGRSDAVLVYVPSGDWWVAWSDGQQFVPPSLLITGFGNGSAAQMLADVNGDGRADASLSYTPSGDWWVAPSILARAGFGPVSRWTTGLAPGPATRLLADADGDGKADAIAIIPNGDWWVAPSTGSTFVSSTRWLTARTGTPVGCMDVNGDARGDAILAQDRALVASLSQSSGGFYAAESPNWSFQLAVPPDPALVGFTVVFQGVGFGTDAPTGIDVTNALFLTIE